mmetsp:Transcript_37112/g.58417  ORF Transcript_37112/g.58417 Transcript_37112/m.58417 type:complete len:195 (-) Transcript_37112:123-707(-)|eukprot:CAMPEP_0201536642 /NCGR_PEP_ID=MMETSP0161_2-20130828/62462_1 /ASSEMBLY_ACC=CAM_ASM_000251 /TAXON_ID=180227 /ORGANISM="Neoparamoeba aestuarina, Strain SoJaBio B1-5/56/2" /LENGTH=194 /DNA_ID=CAMNT_0047942479 /DNA_START=77 /DNA_END=661 /DNA_ORIENTATION=-
MPGRTSTPRASKATAPSKKEAASPKKKTPVKRAGTMQETAAAGEKFLKKAERAAHAKAKAKAPTYRDMAIEAITALKSGRKGVSAQAISKYIKETYKLEPGHHLKLALKSGVEKGVFEKVTAGTYKLGPNAKPKAKKKAAPKKAASAKKAAGTKKKAAPKKKAATTAKKAGGSKKKSAGAKKAGSKGKKAAAKK